MLHAHSTLTTVLLLCTSLHTCAATTAIVSFAQQSMAKTAEAENMAIAHINVKEQKQLEALADRNLCLKVRRTAAPLHCLYFLLFSRAGLVLVVANVLHNAHQLY
jgi:hypothetical protein